MVAPLSTSITTQMTLYRLPEGAKLEKQLRVHTGMYLLSFCLEHKSCAALDKGITIVFVLRLDLIA
jgi:hypothetical protein